MKSYPMNIAIVGIGVAGLTAAYILQKKHNVTLFEKNDYIGGHTHTIVLESGPDAGTPIDTGFIVLNNRTYPTFKILLSQLGAEIRDTVMSFSFYDEKNGFYYSGTNLDTLFAQRRNLFRPNFYWMLKEVVRFNKTAKRELIYGTTGTETVGQYLKRKKFSQYFQNNYLLPMSAAIWSTSTAKMNLFPIESLLRFFDNHGLLNISDRPQWHTVIGGSHAYVKAFLKQFCGIVHLNAKIQTIRRTPEGIELNMKTGDVLKYDAVVLGAHANESLHLLSDPSVDEKKLLGVWNYENNRVILHYEPSLMPPRKKAWSSWNYIREISESENSSLSLTYYMNLLQGLNTQNDYFVSVNPNKTIPEEFVIKKFAYSHPGFTLESYRTQQELPKLNGQRNTYFCGSYFGYGFHEDAVKSGVAVGKHFGLEL